jgi:outer membrane receptor protein involved in Fe transport
VVVTGSRIPRLEVTTAAPVTVISKEQIEATGRTSIGEILQTIPEQSNGINTQFNNGGDGSTRINLRGLGASRTLVLLNGRRHVPGGTGADASVDLNSIPTAAIQRIEILKDGGSAVYGSDAIAGVVNIVTRKDFSGTELRAFTGLSGRGDGLLYDLSLTTGQYTDKGNLLFHAGYYSQGPVWAGNRSFSRIDYDYDWPRREIVTLGSSSIPEGLVFTRGATGGNEFWSSLTAQYPSATSFINSGGNWRPFNASGITDAGGDLYNYQPENYLATPQQRIHLYTTGGYKLGASARAYFEASYTNRQSSQKLAPEPLFTSTEAVVVSAANPHNPFGRNFVDVRRRLVEFGTRDYEQDIDTFRIVSGVEGSLPEAFGPLQGWGWDVSFNFGRTQGTEVKEGLLRRSRLQAAIGPGFIDPATGQARCGTPTAPVADCVPLNLFGGPGSITEEMKNYLSYKGVQRGFTQQMLITANAHGELFKLSPQGRAAGLAFGYEHRREAGADIPDPLTASGDTTGNKRAITEGSYYINEGYAELNIPIISGVSTEPGTPARDILEITAATRAFNYNTFGPGITYKIGGRVSPIPDVTLRSTWSTAFRAPSISELYLGQLDGFPIVTDPCSRRVQGSPVDAICDAQGVPDDLADDRAQQRTQLGGSRTLRPETAGVLTIGAVFQPRFLKDVSLTVDYYNITLNNAIRTVTANVIMASCYPSQGGESQFCDRINRDADGFITFIRDPLTNVGGDRTSGIDFSLRYTPDTVYGRFGFSADATWLNNFDRTFAGGRVVNARNTYDLSAVYVDWRANFGASWALDPFRAGVNLRYINGFRECQGNSCQVTSATAQAPISRRVENYYTVDANVGYNLESSYGSTSLQVGVNNLLDRAPARVFNGFLADSDAATYDYMGRYFYLRATHNFY